jgi:hypothetical protein
MPRRRQQFVKVLETAGGGALTGRMTALVVIGWAALATAMNVGIGRWCRAVDARSAHDAVATR